LNKAVWAWTSPNGSFTASSTAMSSPLTRQPRKNPHAQLV
jgi:hypothetical protein